MTMMSQNAAGAVALYKKVMSHVCNKCQHGHVQSSPKDALNNSIFNAQQNAGYCTSKTLWQMPAVYFRLTQQQP